MILVLLYLKYCTNSVCVHKFVLLCLFVFHEPLKECSLLSILYNETNVYHLKNVVMKIIFRYFEITIPFCSLGMKGSNKTTL